MENKLLSKEEFIRRANLVHFDKYDYSNAVYLGNKVKLEIICKLHGFFMQIPNAHTRGVGCPKCSYINKVNYNKKEVYKEENRNKECSLYVLELTTSDESFLKIGVTKNNVKSRYYGFKKYFNYKILLELPLNIKESYEIEKDVIEKLSKYKYIPQVKFPGYKECLDINYKDEVLSKIKNNIIEKYDKNPMVGEILDFEYNN